MPTLATLINMVLDVLVTAIRKETKKESKLNRKK